MRRAIVHIGMPRTGSTSFQGMLCNLRSRLEGVGVLYPELSLPGQFGDNPVNHKALAEALHSRSAAERRAGAACLETALATTEADTVILSYEDFALQRPGRPVPERLREILAAHGFAMEVAIVVKPVAEYLDSIYGLRIQLLRETRSFGAFARDFGRTSESDYEARIAPWLASAARVVAVPLRDARSDLPLLRRLVRDTGLGKRLTPIVKAHDLRMTVNRSPGPIAAEASRRLCAMRVQAQFKRHPRAIGHALDEAAWSRGLDAEPFRGDAPETVAAIEARLARAQERFARRFWDTSWDQVVKPRPARPPNELAGKPIPDETEQQIEALVGEIVTRFGFRRRSALLTGPVNLLESAAKRLVRPLNHRRWRV